MIAHSLRLGGCDTEISQREHAPHFLRLGLFLSACTGIGLFSFFHSLEHAELISSYGLWFLLLYNGIAIKTTITLVVSVAMMMYAVSTRLLPDSPRDSFRLTVHLVIAASTFVALYLLTTDLDRGWTISEVATHPLAPTGSYRVFLTDDTFIVFLPLVINNFLMGVVAYVRDGDFFATLHRRHLTLGLIPSALALATMLPYEALQLDHLYLYVVASAIGYVLAFALSLQLEYGNE